MNRRGIRSARAGNSSSWLTTFNDLITLLMVFFVLLFTMATTDLGKLKQFQVSIMRGLGVLEKGEKSPIGVIESFGDKGSERGVNRFEMFVDGPESIAEYLESLRSFEGIDIQFRGKHPVMRLDDSALFESGSARISPAAYPMLKELLKVIKAGSYWVRVEGHTDNLPIYTNRFESNWELSTARAVNIVKYFIEAGDVAPERLSAVGYGESRPLEPNDTPQHRARNRRVEIVLEKREEK
ncbi:MAG: flagellar motor protein MotB [Desulfobacteraceae bacterium]